MRPPMLDPKRDLKGATPEKLAKALFRRLVPSKPAEAVVSDQVTVEKVPANEAGNRVPHLRKRS